MAREFQMGARMTLKDHFSKQLKTVKNATNMFKTSVEGANSETAEMVNRQLRARDSMDRFSRETHQATNALEENRRATDRLGDSMRMVKGLIAGVVSSMAAVAAKRWLVDTNAEWETYENTLRVVLGSQEAAIKQLEWAEKFATETPFQLGQVVEATTRMQAYGLEARKVLGITGDMAAVMGKDLMQAVEAVADAQTGELERLKEFGITKDMIIEQAEALGTVPVNTKGQITDLKAFNAALFSLMEERYAGGMVAQAKTWKGMISNAEDFITRLGRALGQPIFEEMKNQLSGLLDTLNRLEESGTIERWVQKVRNGVQGVKKVFNDYIKPSVNFLIGAGKTIKDNWDWIGPFVKGIAAAWAGYYAITKGIAMYQAIATGVQWAYNAAITAYQSIGLIAIGITEGWTGVQAALNAVMSANPIGLIVAAIGLLIGVLILAYKKSETFRNIVNSVWSSIWSKVQPIITILRTSILNAFNTVLNWVQTYWPKIQTIITWVWAVIGPFVNAAVKTLALIIKTGFSLILGTVQRVMGMIGGIIRIGWSIISGIFGIALSLLTGDWQGAWDAMLGMLNSVWTGIKQFFSNLSGLFFDAGKTLISTLVEGIKNMAMAPVNAVKNVLKKARDLLPFSDAKVGPFSNLTDSGGAIMTTLAKGVMNRAGEFHKAIKKNFETVPALNVQGNVSGQISEAPAVSLSPAAINPGGTVTNSTSKKSISIQNLIGSLELRDVGSKDVDQLVNELISKLYDRLSDADEILSTGEMGVLLNG